jgi:hypothetical protein
MNKKLSKQFESLFYDLYKIYILIFVVVFILLFDFAELRSYFFNANWLTLTDLFSVNLEMILSVLGTSATIATGITMLVYIYDNSRIRRNSEENARYERMPFLKLQWNDSEVCYNKLLNDLYLPNNDASNEELRNKFRLTNYSVTNIGRGIAKNIQFHATYTSDTSCVLPIKNLSLLEPNTNVQLQSKIDPIISSGPKIDTRLIALPRNHLEVGVLKIIVSCEDLLGEKYQQTFQNNPSNGDWFELIDEKSDI